MEDDKIKDIKYINVTFMNKESYKVEMYDFQLTLYTLEHAKQLEKTNFVKTEEPKINRLLNPGFIKNSIKKRILIRKK